MPKGVACEVNSCTFWVDDNKCSADQIHIQTDFAALIRSMKSEFSAELNQNEHEIKHSIDTCCETYKRKGEADE